MKAELLNLEKKTVGEIELSEHVFALPPRADIIKRVVDWQLAKARAVSHSVKTVGEVSGTTKKPFRQKGTGRARQGNARGVQRRGGGIAHGPQIRSHETKLQKKVRSLGLKHALSVKMSTGKLFFVEDLNSKSPKTKDLLKNLKSFGDGRFYMIDGINLDNNTRLASQSIMNSHLSSIAGVNVLDIMKNDFVIISKQALTQLEERLK